MGKFGMLLLCGVALAAGIVYLTTLSQVTIGGMLIFLGLPLVLFVCVLRFGGN